MATVDLSQLPPPDLLEVVNFETLFAQRMARFIASLPADQQASVAAAMAYESDTLRRLLQENTYEDVVLRLRVNDAARQTLLAFATGSNLDHLAAFYGETRLVVDAGDATASPPVPPTLESDADFRARVQLAPESFTTCGTVGAYKKHALGANGQVLDASVTSPVPGQVLVTILSRSGNGTPDVSTLDAVRAVLTADDVRSVNDDVVIASANIVNYRIQGVLTVGSGPSAGPILDEARASVAAYTSQAHRLGGSVVMSALYAAMHRPGVVSVALTTPLTNISCSPLQAPFCTGIDLSIAEPAA